MRTAERVRLLCVATVACLPAHIAGPAVRLLVARCAADCGAVPRTQRTRPAGGEVRGFTAGTGQRVPCRAVQGAPCRESGRGDG